MILVDTSVWIDFLRGADSRERRALHKLIENEADLSITGIVLTEILQGIKSDRDFETMKNYLLDFPIISPKGEATFIEAARLFRLCGKNGRSIRKTVDCIIAAICIESDHVLLHKDADFIRIASCSPLICYPV